MSSRLRMQRIPISQSYIPEAKRLFPQTSIGILKLRAWHRRKIHRPAIRRSSFSPPEKRAPRKRENPFTPPFLRMEAGTRLCWIFHSCAFGPAQSIRSGLIFSVIAPKETYILSNPRGSFRKRHEIFFRGRCNRFVRCDNIYVI